MWPRRRLRHVLGVLRPESIQAKLLLIEWVARVRSAAHRCTLHSLCAPCRPAACKPPPAVPPPRPASAMGAFASNLGCKLRWMSRLSMTNTQTHIVYTLFDAYVRVSLRVALIVSKVGAAGARREADSGWWVSYLCACDMRRRVPCFLLAYKRPRTCGASRGRAARPLLWLVIVICWHVVETEHIQIVK